MNLILEERETHLSMTADNRGVWIVFTDDDVMMRRLEGANAEFIRTVGAGKEYRLKADQVTFRKGKRRVSEEQRAKLSERLSRMRRNASTV